MTDNHVRHTAPFLSGKPATRMPQNPSGAQKRTFLSLSHRSSTLRHRQPALSVLYPAGFYWVPDWYWKNTTPASANERLLPITPLRLGTTLISNPVVASPAAAKEAAAAGHGKPSLALLVNHST